MLRNRLELIGSQPQEKESFQPDFAALVKSPPQEYDMIYIDYTSSENDSVESI